MRHITYILAIVLFASCERRGTPKSDAHPTQQARAPELETLTAGSYLLSFGSTDSFATTDIYGDLDFRLRLTDTLDNMHNRAKEIQSYLMDKFSEYFYTTDSTVVLRLTNGNTESFPNWDHEKEEGYNFEHYFDKIDYYLLRVQWSEGNCWLLVNRKNGFKRYICGLPYISLDNKKMITINSDLEAGYSFNGLELYSILEDSLREEFKKETTWGPTNVKWINEDQFLLKREHFNVDSVTGNVKYIIDYKEVTIDKDAKQ